MNFEEGKIIDKFVVGKDIEIVLRYPKAGDAKQLMGNYKKIMKETEFLSRITPLTLSEEKKWLKETLSKIKNKDSVFLLAVADKKIVGSASIRRRTEESHHHAGVFSIAVSQEFNGLGIGSKLAENIMKMARTINLEIIESCCFSDNERSLRLHKKFGFKAIGKFPKGLKKKNKYYDEILLYKILVSKQ